ncbi:hypothetical protein DPMN_093942 [Dreissena polymorpha]|uniref:Uncharacterized protein n=1 Tax=Dreissena polymorpha TaxID=45954 RepID=A0A9D4R319_DREPO|nr:hypothetical protein DPMN_093942 [Dreissena polymorpha]
MADKQGQRNDSYFNRVLKRTRELAKISAGKANNTPGNPERPSETNLFDTQLGEIPKKLKSTAPFLKIRIDSARMRYATLRRAETLMHCRSK